VLGYFFIAIAFGLGFGADQILPTLIGAIVLFVIIVISGNRKVKNTVNQNLIIHLSEIANKDTAALQSRITEIISSNASRTELIRLNKDKDNLNFNFLVVLANYDSVNKITSDLSQLDGNTSITFIDSNNMVI
jgi:uncharacterized membrane protein YhiD involved in acid resistance